MCELANPVCALSGAFLPEEHLLLGLCTLQMPGQEERGRGGSLCWQQNAGPGKRTIFRVIPFGSTNLFPFRIFFRKDSWVQGTENPFQMSLGKSVCMDSWALCCKQGGKQLGFMNKYLWELKHDPDASASSACFPLSAGFVPSPYRQASSISGKFGDDSSQVLPLRVSAPAKGLT